MEYKSIKNLSLYLIIFVTGSLFGDLFWHIRLKTPILLRELLLDLESGGTPFLDWFWGLMIFPIIMWALYFIGFGIIERKHKIKEKGDNK